MSTRFQKTDAGREEIRARKLDLSRPARTLLLIVDGTKSGDEWLAMVAGATAADLQRLVDAGMLSAQVDAAPAPAAKEPPLAEVLEGTGFRALYDYLTGAARPRLGLIKGYRTVLEIERCTEVADLRRLALRFVELVREAQGDAAAREVGRELAALR
jgi:hypothetical protein